MKRIKEYFFLVIVFASMIMGGLFTLLTTLSLEKNLFGFCSNYLFVFIIFSIFTYILVKWTLDKKCSYDEAIIIISPLLPLYAIIHLVAMVNLHNYSSGNSVLVLIQIALTLSFIAIYASKILNEFSIQKEKNILKITIPIFIFVIIFFPNAIIINYL